MGHLGLDVGGGWSDRTWGVSHAGGNGPSASFFFSSRRRHTRYWRDWSSDVCSSDLGELPFTEAYHHLLSRPQLAQEFDLHLMGGGGELLRYFPWGQEFFGIGRRRLASVNRLLDYRFLDVAPPPSLFSQNWLPALRSRLRARIEAICGEQPGTRTTQQLDAVYAWKRTNHESLYISAVYDWLPSVAPLLSAGVVKAAVSMPWKMRLTSQLQRRMIHAMSPRAAGAAATV